MNSISKTFTFEAAHIVRDAISERCRHNVHGHSYKVEVCISGDVRSNGMVLDFKELGFMKKSIDLFDHAMVLWDEEKEDVKKFFLDNFKRVIIMRKNCTAENMSRFFYKKCVEEITKYSLMKHETYLKVEYIKVWETANSYAYANEYSEDDTIWTQHKEED